MATLTGLQIDASYLGLLKTTDNLALGPAAKVMTDGAGNATNITMGTTSTNFVSGTVDFTGSTVSGLGVVSAGLVEGNYSNSIKAGGSLTGISANTAQGWESMAVGQNCVSASPRSTALGQSSTAGTFGSAEGGAVAIGWNVIVSGEAAVGIGGSGTKPNRSTGNNAITIGQNINANAGTNSIIIGNDINVTGNDSVAMGRGNSAVTDGITIGRANSATSSYGYAIGTSCTAASTSIAIGFQSTASGPAAIVIGGEGSATGLDGMAIGREATSGANVAGMAIGRLATASAAGAVALGLSVTAAKVNTVAVTELETKLAGGGITMVSANGTEYKLTVSNAGALVIT